jgi:plastocyanin
MPSRGLKGVARLVAVMAGSCGLATLGGCSIKQAHQANIVTGKKVFVQKCGSCHTLARAGTKGIIGPNLDDAFRNALASGLKRNTIKGAVHQQVLFPEIGGVMPAKLVDSELATDIAAYVSYAVDRPGQDSGLLATAVPTAGAGQPATEVAGTLEIDADPNGQLAYVTKQATAKAGKVTIKMSNKSGTQHNIALQVGTNGAIVGAGAIITNGVSSFVATLKPGTYTYFCQVPGHRQAGMLGTLTVK